MSDVEVAVWGRPLIERIARSIAFLRFRAEGGHGQAPHGGRFQWQDYVEIVWRLYIGDAIALLNEIQEPTAAMVAVGNSLCADGEASRLPDDNTAAHVFRGMIEAAVREGWAPDPHLSGGKA